MEKFIEPDITLIDDRVKITNPILASMHREADTIQRFMLAEDVDITDGNVMNHRLKIMDQHLARLSEMLIRAKAMRKYAETQFQTLNEEALERLSATNANKVTARYTCEFAMTTERLDMMYSTLSKMSSNIVTQISFLKSTMQIH